LNGTEPAVYPVEQFKAACLKLYDHGVGTDKSMSPAKILT
jgi:hypothetical protein